MGRLLAALLLTSFDQDRADLPKSIDTWYRVVKGTRQVGYVHETIDSATFPWRYAYSRDGEMELTLQGRTHSRGGSSWPHTRTRSCWPHTRTRSSFSRIPEPGKVI